jgi:serine/threonine protein kinase
LAPPQTYYLRINPFVGGLCVIGSAVSHYRVIEKLGGGGMGVVYKAEDTMLGRFVALKFLPDNLAQDPHALERFRLEARAASALNHPNICTIHEIARHNGQWFLVMEFMEGATLKYRIAGKPLPLEEVLDLGVQIADGLEVAHEEGIVHRDIKPANLFVTTRGQAKILDFGLAKVIPALVRGTGSDVTVETASLEDELTSKGSLLGTIPYMSPEQVRGQPVDSRTDLFSFGAVLYEMTTGVGAFPGANSAAVLESILHAAPNLPSRLNPSMPAEMERIVCKALEKDRKLRYQSASELRADLQRLRRDTESTEIRLELESAAGQSRKPWLGLKGAVVVSAIVIAALVAAFRPWRTTAEAPGARMLVQHSLTTNPPENPVYAATISPDGRYLAYADFTGVFVRLLETGETHSLPLPDGFCFR